jgi:tetratricopeptide (TPR) repeat protein
MGPRRFVRLLPAALLFAAIAHPVFAQIGRVNGVAKDEDGQPLKGATITADNSNIGQSFTSTTDDKGRFQLLGLRSGTWRFIAQAPGFEPEVGTLPVRMGAPNPPLTFILKRGGPTAYGALGGITNKELQRSLADADALLTQSRWDEAAAAYRAIAARSPALLVVNLQAATAYRGKKDYDAALAVYDEILRVDPDNTAATLGIVATHLERGDAQAAEAILLKAAERQPAGRDIYYQLGEVKLSQDAAAEAATWFRKASEVDPFWGKPLYKLGLVALKGGDTAAASQLMTKVISIDPMSPEASLAKTTIESLKK